MNIKSVSSLTSIIIPCWNQLEFTRQCVCALLRHTRSPWELIVVNNGSTDGTGDYLAGLQDASPVPVTVIANPANRGFPAANNQGLRQARGDYLVLLNNDAVVTDGWLDQMIALAHIGTDDQSQAAPPADVPPQHGRRFDAQVSSDHNHLPPALTPVDLNGGMPSVIDASLDDFVRDIHNAAASPADCPSVTVQSKTQNRESKIGLVGPMSNYAAPPQLVNNVPYHDLDGMHTFARACAQSAGVSGSPYPSCRGFACS